MLAVVDNKPQQLNLRTALTCFLDHRREVVIRRTRFDLEKAQARAHIVEGLLKALDIIDEIVSLIRGSETPQEAKSGLGEPLRIHGKFRRRAFSTCACSASPASNATSCSKNSRELQKLIALPDLHP